MNKKIGIFLIVSLILGSLVGYKYSTGYDIQKESDHGEVNLKGKDIKEAVDFVFDDKENIYIAFPHEIKKITSSGDSKRVYGDENEIYSIEYLKGKIYAYIGNEVKSIDLNSYEVKSLVKGIPNIGDYKDGEIKLNKNKLYISVGANTNSGVVGEDNIWSNTYKESCDIPTYGVTLRGVNYGDTGAFVPKGSITKKIQKIKGGNIGNASIITYDLLSKEISTYGYGIRNVKGMDFDEGGNLYAGVGGMEDRGSRPVKGDYDYIYKIEKGGWYGWPDYSGGDSLDSPRFNCSLLLSEVPTINPPSPLYANKNVSSIESLSIKDNIIYFIDNKDKVLKSLNLFGATTGELKFPDDFNLKKVKIHNDNIYMLENKEGMIFKYDIDSVGKKYDNIIVILLVIILIIIVLMIILLKKSLVKSKELRMKKREK